MRLALPRFFRERSNELGDEERFCLGVTQDENGAAVVASIDSDSLSVLHLLIQKDVVTCQLSIVKSQD